jgi:non-ribosomal peptide synthetase component F
MNSQAVSLRDAGLDASAPAHADWTRAAHTADPRRAPVEVRALSVLQDASALRWRYGERLDDVLDDACRRFAERVAISAEGGDYTFSDLDARANQMARYFISEGVRRRPRWRPARPRL